MAYFWHLPNRQYCKIAMQINNVWVKISLRNINIPLRTEIYNVFCIHQKFLEGKHDFSYCHATLNIISQKVTFGLTDVMVEQSGCVFLFYFTVLVLDSVF